MKALALYLVTGVVTGFHVFYLMMLAIWGAPISPLQYVSMMGSAGLLVASVVAVFKPRLASEIALAGAIAIWSFYIPALVVDFWRLVTGAFAFKDELIAITPILLLAICTGYAVRCFLRCRTVRFPLTP